jgi:hypothetical protein
MTQITVDTEDLVSATDIAFLFGVTVAAVSNWQARDLGFPEPVLSVANGSTKLWSKRDIVKWFVSREGGEEQIRAHYARVKSLVDLIDEHD